MKTQKIFPLQRRVTNLAVFDGAMSFSQLGISPNYTNCFKSNLAAFDGAMSFCQLGISPNNFFIKLGSF
jgi:hypothetical protein